MEIEFQKTKQPYINRVLAQTCSSEQTQDVRLPDGMPDIGRIIATWGQPLVRSKEWRDGGIGATGGVVAWVLYEAEDSSEIYSVQTWVPFQWRWDIKESSGDGQLELLPVLKSIDARVTSAGKILVRASVDMHAEAFRADVIETCLPLNVPSDVQTLFREYPFERPVEAGEKVFSADEEITLPRDYDESTKPLYCKWRGVISERKIMADKLVFHGYSLIHMLYMSSDGKVKTWDIKLPFSQYAQLEHDYGSGADAQIRLILTGMETEMVGDKCIQHLTMAAQYLIYDTEMISICEDAYSIGRNASIDVSTMRMPVRLEQRCDPIKHNLKVQNDYTDIVDLCWLHEHPSCYVGDDVAQLTHNGHLHALYYGENGRLISETIAGNENLQIPCANDVMLGCEYEIEDKTLSRRSDGQEICVDGLMHIEVHAFSEIPMVTGITLDEEMAKSANRPSLIIKRCGDATLWEIAKACGSTVAGIMAANDIQQEPDRDQLLLIPMLR